uniref:Uncharacterized protein n=1 Tax=Rhizophora mucronata TaxID=61149 RepID=A0A2P2PLH4_RHIMU
MVVAYFFHFGYPNMKIKVSKRVADILTFSSSSNLLE